MDEDTPTSSGQIYWLGEPERAELAKKAEAGDAEAAFRLVQYYTFTHSDPDRRGHWLLAAARLGHRPAQYNLAVDLCWGGKDLAQAAHWAAEAGRNGDAEAARLLQRIEALRTGAPKQSGTNSN
jgi:TPR repeat protein